MKQNLEIEAKFLLSASSLANAPEPTLSEIAFLGRSNVGKSSLLNALCGRGRLAKTSATPGKTRLINFYEIKAQRGETQIRFRFVDLPGFGYAKTSKAEREAWEARLPEFLQSRRSIRLFLRLIDSRHTDLPQDRAMSDFARVVLNPDQADRAVYTKADKLNRRERDDILRRQPDALLISASSGEGLNELWDRIIESVVGT
ncbi:MAG: ribosome biogenesis GTP-binding protein YihA/YsxC [Helicobacteraceae bacterium]|jgi:GTP-binding protein|nr:ribosome biogenesis GTP-binding protein YihA/YsxC [Helicobacteraceae bacterium]